MALKIVEFFGHASDDASAEALAIRGKLWCPLVDRKCSKTLSDGTISGACTVRQANSGPVICCPKRLYDGNYQVLHDVAEAAFGAGTRLIFAGNQAGLRHDGLDVLVFGKGSGKELPLPRAGGQGGFFVDWILALVDLNGSLKDFVAVEVQSIDTTGNYRGQRDTLLRGQAFSGYSKAGLNWENVSKRILPQIVYKGHVLRRERLCTKGMFFVCPTPVYQRIAQRLGGNLLAYPTLQPGSLAFRWYDIGPPVAHGQRRGLVFGGQFITTIDQVGLALTAPPNLPRVNVYEDAINAAIRR